MSRFRAIALQPGRQRETPSQTQNFQKASSTAAGVASSPSPTSDPPRWVPHDPDRNSLFLVLRAIPVLRALQPYTPDPAPAQGTSGYFRRPRGSRQPPLLFPSDGESAGPASGRRSARSPISAGKMGKVRGLRARVHQAAVRPKGEAAPGPAPPAPEAAPPPASAAGKVSGGGAGRRPPRGSEGG